MMIQGKVSLDRVNGESYARDHKDTAHIVYHSEFLTTVSLYQYDAVLHLHTML